MQFYDVRGVLVRRCEPVRKGVVLEVWDGDVWLPYSDVSAALRYGEALTESRAIALLHRARKRLGTLPQLSDSEARIVLSAPQKLA